MKFSPPDYQQTSRFTSKQALADGQRNRHDRDGDWLLRKIVDELGIEGFTRQEVIDSFSPLTERPPLSSSSARTINVATAFGNLVTRKLIFSDDNEQYYITRDGIHWYETDEGEKYEEAGGMQ